METEQPFKPTTLPIPLEQLAEYNPDGSVVIKRSDVDKAVALASIELRSYLLASQKK